MIKKAILTYKRKKIIAGYIFATPFILGFLIFFLFPFSQSIIFSFNELNVTSTGYILNFRGLGNYYDALFVHAQYLRVLISTIIDIIINLPLIIMFSLFAAVLLNHKFKGRFLVRIIFFLPVIMGAGIIRELESADYLMNALQPGADSSGGLLGGEALYNLLINTNLPDNMLNYILEVVTRLPEVIRSSAIQILIFLAGLQSIPNSMYEASKVEGATAWENFWKITFPLMTPIILVNVVYTVVDAILNNSLVDIIRSTAIIGMGFGVSSAMSWLFFIIISFILGIILFVFSKWTFYQK